MCTTCGCSNGAKPKFTDFTHEKVRFVPVENARGREHHHHASQDAEAHARRHGTKMELEQAVLAKNDRQAALNREWLRERNILALNLVSSPGSGKTTLLERTLRDLGNELDLSVIEGDQETTNDAERIRATGAPVVQINTGTGCHLEADMLKRGLEHLGPADDSLVLIENVGNLVCPALFDLGEQAKVAILSVTEGDDKPLKYPHMFRAARLVIINKIDLLPYVDFDLEQCVEYARRVNPGVRILALSATRGDGLSDWYAWIARQRAALSGQGNGASTPGVSAG